MKITIFIGGLSGGGAERVACNLANYLSTRGYAVDIVTMSDDISSYSLNLKIKRHMLLLRNERKFFLTNCILRWRRLKHYVSTSDTKCYLVMLPIPTAFLLALHKYIQAPVLVAERNDPARISAYWRFLLKHLFKYASGFIFQTEDAHQYYVPYIQNKPFVIIPNAINPEFIRAISFENRQKQIIAIGRFCLQKNFMLLLRAFASIHNDYPEYTLTIYGQGRQRFIMENFIKQNNLENVVLLPGYVKDIPKRLLQASVFVLSSDYEGMPNALMEAMASGLACIATDCPCGGPRFLIQNKENGLLFPVGDQKSLEQALRHLLRNTNLRQKLGTNATKIQQVLEPKKIYKQWEEFINKQL